MAERGAHPPSVDILSSLRRNPFDEELDPERASLWEMLVARDNEAFAAGDWAPVADDFWGDRFEGVSAHGSSDPAAWTLAWLEPECVASTVGEAHVPPSSPPGDVPTTISAERSPDAVPTR